MTGPPALAVLGGVTVRFGSRTALEGVDLRLVAGERVAVIGSSGAGKTTLLGVLNGSVAPTVGTVRLLGEDPAALGARARRELQRQIGTVYQQLHLVGPLRVIHNVNAGRLGHWSLARAAASLLRPREAEGALDALARMGIGDRAHDRTERLSGGQQQRVALARVLVQDPRLVLADEPVSALDPLRAREVVDLLTGMVAGSGRGLVVSVHRIELARAGFDRVVGLRAGRVVLDGPPGALTPERVAELYALDPAPR